MCHFNDDSVKEAQYSVFLFALSFFSFRLKKQTNKQTNKQTKKTPNITVVFRVSVGLLASVHTFIDSLWSRSGPCGEGLHCIFFLINYPKRWYVEMINKNMNIRGGGGGHMNRFRVQLCTLASGTTRALYTSKCWTRTGPGFQSRACFCYRGFEPLPTF